MSDNFNLGKSIKFSDLGVKFNVPKPHLEPIPFNNLMKNVNSQLNEQVKVINATQARKEAYDQEVLQTLKNIESNTVGLNEVIPLLSKSIGNQEEILNYLKEALSISASSTKEEAESKWRTVMNKATQITTDVENIQKLHGFANTILKLFIDN